MARLDPMFRSISNTSPLGTYSRKLSPTSDISPSPTMLADQTVYIMYIDSQIHDVMSLLATLGVRTLDWTCYICGARSSVDLTGAASPRPVDDTFFKRQQTKTLIQLGLATKSDLADSKAKTPSPSTCSSRFCVAPAKPTKPVLRPLTDTEYIRASIAPTPTSIMMGAVHAILYGPYTSHRVSGARSSDVKLTCPVEGCEGLLSMGSSLVKPSITIEEATMLLVSLCTSGYIKMEIADLSDRVHKEAMDMTRSMNARNKCNHHI